MINATRVAAVVALLALTTSLAYVAMPATQPDVAPGAPVEAGDFAAFTGTFTATSCGGGQMTGYEWGHTIEGALCSPMSLEVSDERLSGSVRAVHNAIRFAGGPTYGVRTVATEIVNDGGGWEGTGIAFHDADDNVMRYEFLLSGQDGYAGLSAMLSLVSDSRFIGHEAQGVVFPGELPPVPDLGDVEETTAWGGEIDPDDFAGFNGEVIVGWAQGTGRSNLGDFGTQVRDVAYWDMVVESTDPRMAGTQESNVNYDSFSFEHPGRVHTSVDKIVNDDGVWTSTSWGYLLPESGTTRYVGYARGAGRYEGLTAIIITVGHPPSAVLDMEGVIFPGELPPYPELPSTE